MRPVPRRLAFWTLIAHSPTHSFAMAVEMMDDARLEAGLEHCGEKERLTATAAHEDTGLSTPSREKDNKMRRRSIIWTLAFLLLFGLSLTSSVSPTRLLPSCRDSSHGISPEEGPRQAEADNRDAQESAFRNLLKNASPDVLHRLLHAYFPERYRHGVYESEDEALEAVRADDAPLATTMAQMAKRQDNDTDPPVDSTTVVVISTTTVDSEPDEPSATTAEPEPSDEPEPEPSDDAEPTADPEPTTEPTTEPTPEPTSDPEPTEDPDTTGNPGPEPTPDPEPTSDADPEPTPEPTAEPTPEPTPEPSPEPTPEPTPDPEPTVTLDPTTEPEPTADPTEDPEPTAEPSDDSEQDTTVIASPTTTGTSGEATSASTTPPQSQPDSSPSSVISTFVTFTTSTSSLSLGVSSGSSLSSTSVASSLSSASVFGSTSSVPLSLETPFSSRTIVEDTSMLRLPAVWPDSLVFSKHSTLDSIPAPTFEF